MATTLPAIRGTMGSIEFYQGKMRARELTAAARPASEVDDWANGSLEDRIQRELNQTRVRQEIAPYLLQDADRFFGSILVLVQNPVQFEFEPLSDVVSKVPNAYKAVMDQVGTLTIDGGELIVLDGQHRYSALRMVIQRQDDKGQILNGPYATEVPDDELVVVFVELDTVKTRKIFNKINKHAKSTSTTDNIITSEADGYAIVSRRLMQEGAPLSAAPSGLPLVNWKTTNLTGKDVEFTTLSAVYQTVKDVLNSEGIRDFDERSRVVAPSEDELVRATELASEWWEVFKTMPAIDAVLSDERGFPELRKTPDYKYALLLRPVLHIVLFKTLAMTHDLGLGLTEAVDRLSRISWSADSPLWENLILRPNGRIIARNENYERTSTLLAYMIANELMDAEQIFEIGAETARFLGRVYAELPEAAEAAPERLYTLPAPVEI